MARDEEDERLLDVLKRVMIVTRMISLADGSKKDIVFFLDAADTFVSYYLDKKLDKLDLVNEPDPLDVRKVMTGLSKRTPQYLDVLLGETPPGEIGR